MRRKAGISGIPLTPTLTPSMRAGPENMEGRSPCHENNDSLPYKFLGVISILYNLRKKNSFNWGIFFFWREIEISFKILAADGLRSHVTITLRDKSRYDLILKTCERNCITSAGWIDFCHQESKVKVSVLFTENR